MRRNRSQSAEQKQIIFECDLHTTYAMCRNRTQLKDMAGPCSQKLNPHPIRSQTQSAEQKQLFLKCDLPIVYAMCRNRSQSAERKQIFLECDVPTTQCVGIEPNKTYGKSSLPINTPPPNTKQNTKCRAKTGISQM